MITTITVNPSYDRIYFIDDFSINHLHRIDNQHKKLTPGGVGIDVSIMLQRYKVPSIAMGFLGGSLGRKIARDVAALGITANFIRIADKTRQNMFVIDKKNNLLTAVCEPGPVVENDDIAMFIANYSKVLHQASLVFIGGSLLPQLSSDFYYQLISLAKEKNVPTFIHAPHQYLSSALKSHPTFLYPDLRETDEFYGFQLKTEADFVSCGKAILKNNPGTKLLIFHCKQVLICLTPEKGYRFKFDELQKSKTLGLSNSIIAGILYGIEKKLPLSEVVSLGYLSGVNNIENQYKTDIVIDQFDTLTLEGSKDIAMQEFDLNE